MALRPGRNCRGHVLSGLLYLIPIALFLGLVGLGAFMWAMRSGQFDDLDGAAERILHDEEDDEDHADEPPSKTP